MNWQPQPCVCGAMSRWPTIPGGQFATAEDATRTIEKSKFVATETTLRVPEVTIPKRCHFISLSVADEPADPQKEGELTGGSTARSVRVKGVLQVGVFHLQDDFVSRAKCIATHPFDSMCVVPDIIAEAIFRILSKGKDNTVAARKQELLKWRRLREKVAKKEALLHARMPAAMKKVCEKQQITLLQHLLDEYVGRMQT
jgi:hypothetical protein